MNPSVVVDIVIGTRPEAIKMAPIYREFLKHPHVTPRMIATGQHKELLAQTLHSLEIQAYCDLEVMQSGQTLNGVFTKVMAGLDSFWAQQRPDFVLVQGDTTTVTAAALTASHLRIPVGHVEAGLRTYDENNPFPEEANRQLVARVCTLNFAPTISSQRNLLQEYVQPHKVIVTGNTGVDSLLWAYQKSTCTFAPQTLLITLHRRESFGEPLHEILSGIIDFLEQHPDAIAVWPCHPNPHVVSVAKEYQTRCSRLTLCAPMDYVSFAGAIASSKLIVSDSGGIQEEAPSLGKRVLIARDTTERPEAVDEKINILVGRSKQSIFDALCTYWNEPQRNISVPAHNPYGDGHASARIVSAVLNSLQTKES